jgi:phenylacetic acid degradation operon negative regulatory protein
MPMKPNAKHLIMNLLAAAVDWPLTARNAVRACQLFGVSESSTRVTLARLSAEGLIEARERGVYQLTPYARQMAEDVRGWRHALKQLKAWKGDWVGVQVGHLGRSDRTALRRRERALVLTGFRELERGLHLRPDNLRGGVSRVRERLHHRGLETDAMVFAVSELDSERDAQARRLWDTRREVDLYRKTRKELDDWLKRAHRLEPEEAAREAFVIGDRAIRQMVFDPLLPEQLTDPGERQAFFEVLLEYDRRGHEIWEALYRNAAEG